MSLVKLTEGRQAYVEWNEVFKGGLCSVGTARNAHFFI